LYAGAETSIWEFDRLYGELLYELHSGKRKRILERQALPGLSGKPVPGALGYQDLATDTYLVLDPMEQQKPFDDYSPVMRTEEYLAALKALLHLIENQCHLSPGSLALETGSDGPVTATEVVSRDRTTYHTCAAIQEQGLRPALMDLVQAMDCLCDLYGLCPGGAYQASVSFGDGVFEDTDREFDRQLQMVSQGILKPEKLLGWYFHVDEDQARQEFLKN
jgi:A118 family predicted phage portal protein